MEGFLGKVGGIVIVIGQKVIGQKVHFRECRWEQNTEMWKRNLEAEAGRGSEAPSIEMEEETNSPVSAFSAEK